MNKITVTNGSSAVYVPQEHKNIPWGGKKKGSIKSFL